MPFDGILTKSMAKELNEVLSGGRIENPSDKRDALLMQVRASKDNYRLLFRNASS